MAVSMEVQCGFQQRLANEGKLGAYYTDLSHCKSLQGFFKFGKSTLILEPSIGNGEAVKTVVEKVPDDGKAIFGVELNTDTYNSVKEDQNLEAVLNADFLHGTKISNNRFGFCFANPPYGEGDPDGNGRRRRYEVLFIERIFNLLKTGAVACFVIPEYVINQEECQKVLVGRFVPMHVFRFREPEYSKFKQVVFIGIAKSTNGWRSIEVEQFKQMVEDMQVLPEVWTGDKIEVPSGNTEQISSFSKLEFNPDEYLNIIRNDHVMRNFEKRVSTQKKFGEDDLHPPIELKDNLLYLLAISGEGQGLVGNEASGTLHLQRGVAKRVETSSVKEDSPVTDGIEVVTKSTAIIMTLIESDGTITKLQ